MASIMDHKPMVNIKPFGQCQSLANPVVAAATAANYGRLQKMPCVPNTSAPWLNGKIGVNVKGLPALMDNCKCLCLWAGVIEITNPGQDFVSDGVRISSGTATSAPAGTPSQQAAIGGGSPLAHSFAPQGMAASVAPLGIASSGNNLAPQQNANSSGTAPQNANADGSLIPEPNEGEERPIFKVDGSILNAPGDAEEFNKYEATAQFINEEFANDDELTNDNKDKEKNKRNYCYKKMIDKLNAIENHVIGPLLRKAWVKCEEDLMVGDYNLKGRGPISKDSEIHINFKNDINGDNWANLKKGINGDDWIMPFHYIFHEFFHVILGSFWRNLGKSTIKEFGDAIVADVNALIREENNVSIRSTDKRLNNLTYNRLEGKSKAALFDIIGGVLYKGGYGCYPPNSQFYTHDERSCRDKKICVCILDCDKCEADYECNYEKNNDEKYEKERDETKYNKSLERIEDIKARCVDIDKFRVKSDNPNSAVYRCTREKCIFEERNFSYRLECKFENNRWINNNGCYKLWGHGPDYWKNDAPNHYRLVKETFAHMAAEAIVNPTAYEYIIKYLPGSYKKFKEILES